MMLAGAPDPSIGLDGVQGLLDACSRRRVFC
jgi:hypothetical protein